MPGKLPCVNPLEGRKNLLIAESELNRARLAGALGGSVDSLCAELSLVRHMGETPYGKHLRVRQAFTLYDQPDEKNSQMKGTLWELFC